PEEHEVPKQDLSKPSWISDEMMPAIGKQIKRVLDYGRVMYMRQQLGMQVKYVQYCDDSLSPESMLIVASDEGL
ncbi:hypothetical protein EON64_17410, partial [archaeon]